MMLGQGRRQKKRRVNVEIVTNPSSKSKKDCDYGKRCATIEGVFGGGVLETFTLNTQTNQ